MVQDATNLEGRFRKKLEIFKNCSKICLINDTSKYFPPKRTIFNIYKHQPLIFNNTFDSIHPHWIHTNSIINSITILLKRQHLKTFFKLWSHRFSDSKHHLTGIIKCL